jgi:hypothetical protein
MQSGLETTVNSSGVKQYPLKLTARTMVARKGFGQNSINHYFRPSYPQRA